jgi:hypothetical protein
MLAQKQPPFKECVIAHWSSDSAPTIYGTIKLAAEAADLTGVRVCHLVEERCIIGRSGAVRHRRRNASENAGISSE